MGKDTAPLGQGERIQGKNTSILLSCYQANALCAIVGRESLPLATKLLDREEDWAAKTAAGMDKEKGF